jgi:hypothetical protein
MEMPNVRFVVPISGECRNDYRRRIANRGASVA